MGKRCRQSELNSSKKALACYYSPTGAGSEKRAIGPHLEQVRSHLGFVDLDGAENSDAAGNSCYSPRNARMGSMDAALSAGNPEAAKASSNTPTAATDNATGSNGLTPNRSDCNNLEAATAPASPMAQPITANLAPDCRTRRTMDPRFEPSAIRMAISCPREATENEITL